MKISSGWIAKKYTLKSMAVLLAIMPYALSDMMKKQDAGLSRTPGRLHGVMTDIAE